MPDIGADAIRELVGAVARGASGLGALVVGLIATVPHADRALALHSSRGVADRPPVG